MTEVINVITTISTNKATCPNSIPTDILQQIKISIAQTLVNIINLSYEQGTYIEDMKISKVIPTFKDKGSDLECTNFRPISLLSNINKIIEKLMDERLYTFLEKYNLQFGFRRSHSTNHALLDLTEDIRNAMRINLQLVFLLICKRYLTL